MEARSAPSIRRGEASQTWRHREARIWVRPTSLVERSQTISPRTASGRSLMRSTPPPPPASGGGGDSMLWVVGARLAASVASVARGGGSPAARSSDLLLLALGHSGSISAAGGRGRVGTQRRRTGTKAAALDSGVWQLGMKTVGIRDRIRLGLFGCRRIHLNPHVLEWIEMEFSSSSTLIHPNTCGWIRIRLHPNKALKGFYPSLNI